MSDLSTATIVVLSGNRLASVKLGVQLQSTPKHGSLYSSAAAAEDAESQREQAEETGRRGPSRLGRQCATTFVVAGFCVVDGRASPRTARVSGAR
jgi:hypothetical protein